MARQVGASSVAASDETSADDIRAAGTVLRVIGLIKMIAELGGDLSVKQLADRLDLPASTTHRLLQHLVARGIVEHDAVRRRYKVGAELLRIGLLISSRASIKDLARPYMRVVVDNCNEACILVLYLSGSLQVSVVDAINPSHPLRYDIQLDASHSLLWGATGRSVLAFLPEGERNAAIDRNDLSPASGSPPPDRAILMRELESIRARGYACSVGQKIPGAVGIGAPVFARTGMILGSLCLTIPVIRFQSDLETRLASLLKRQAKQLSTSLGYSGQYPGLDADICELSTAI